jgi:hypothetical protein
VSTIAEPNALLDGWDQEDEGRRIADRTRTVGQFFAIERPLLAPLPQEAFETGRVLTPRVDRYAQVTVRMNRYSVPAGLIGRQVRVLLHASDLVVYDDRAEVARHERLAGRGSSRLELDHYLEGLLRKPGALPGATVLEQARAAGRFTPVHDAWWAAARTAHGDAADTRALVEVLLLHRRMDGEHVVAGIAAALRAGADDRRRGRDGGTQGRRRQPAGRRGTARRDPPAVPGGLTHRAAPGRPAGGLQATVAGSRLRPAAAASPTTRHPSRQPGRPIMTIQRHRGLTEPAADAAIDTARRVLRLPTLRAQFTDLAEAAAREQMTYRGFLAELLMAECDDRGRRRSERRIKAACFPRQKELRTFDFEANPNITPETLATLATCEWVRKGQPLCLIGDSGTGKSHLLIALGTEAAMAGYRVRYVLAAKLVNELVEAADDKQLTKTIARYGRVDLLCIASWATWSSTGAAPSCSSRS